MAFLAWKVLRGRTDKRGDLRGHLLGDLCVDSCVTETATALKCHTPGLINRHIDSWYVLVDVAWDKVLHIGPTSFQCSDYISTAGTPKVPIRW